MDDFVGSEDVLSKARVKELSKRRNAPGLIHLASHFGAIGINTYALFLTQDTWWCVPFLFLQGACRQRFSTCKVPVGSASLHVRCLSAAIHYM